MSGFHVTNTGGSIVSSALHAGHELRPSLRPWCALGPTERMREEDPYTDVIAALGTGMLAGRHSRFEVDLNRPRGAAVYRGPEDAWGLEVWRAPLPDAEVARSLELYDRFYEAAAALLDETVAAHGAAVVFDVHSYNHRRGGPDAVPSDPATDPEVNLGTGTLDTGRWGGLVDGVTRALAADGLDVRENVRFRGGHFAAWAHARYGGTVAVLAFEFKKTFMDEWTGAVDIGAVTRLRASLGACVPLAEAAVREAR